MRETAVTAAVRAGRQAHANETGDKMSWMRVAFRSGIGDHLVVIGLPYGDG